MEQNGANYYKGVLLCSRPNQSPSINKQKPFCGRVFPKDQLGLVPTKTYDSHQVKKRVLPVLGNHKKWLQKFKKEIKEKKELEEIQKQKEVQKLQKIKQEGIEARQKAKNTNDSQVMANNNPSKTNVKPNVQEKKNVKGGKPAWALTQKQAQKKEEEEVNDVLNFFDADVKDYLGDQEINSMLKELKGRIQQIKQQGEDWRKKQVNRINAQENKNDQNTQKKDQTKDDILSRISRNSDAKTVASQKTAERVQQLQQKKEQKEWDKSTNTEKKLIASIDDKIAKNIADQVLRNYPALKNHSNQSIRKLLEKHAYDGLKQ